MTTDTSLELTDIVLKTTTSNSQKRHTFKLNWGTAKGTGFASPYSISFTADLEQCLLSNLTSGGDILII